LTRDGFENQNFETICLKLEVTGHHSCYVQITKSCNQLDPSGSSNLTTFN